MKKIQAGLILCLLQMPVMAFAKNMDTGSRFNNMSSGLFAQVGGSYNSVNLNQNINLATDSNVYDAQGTLIGKGSGSGQFYPLISNESIFAPELQLGYAHKVGCDEDWYFGFKLSYKFLGINFSNPNIVSIQSGIITSDGQQNPYTGNIYIASCQANLNSEMNLMAFAGYSMTENYNVYLGISPVLFNSTLSIFNPIGYLNEQGFDPYTEYFSNQWMWGTAGEIGVNYNLNNRWSLNLSYNYAITGTYVINTSGAFTGTIYTQNGQDTTNGTANIATTQRVIAQAIGFAVNFVF